MSRSTTFGSLIALAALGACGGGGEPTGPAGDATAPFVNALSVSPTTVHVSSVSREVTVAATGGDEGGSGVARVTITGTSPSGTTSNCTATSPSSGTATAGTWSCALTIPANTPSGTWALTVVAVDATGNQLSMGRSVLEQKGLPGSFTVNADPDPPVIRTANFDPTTVNTQGAARTVTVTSLVEDSGSGVARYDVIATAPDGVTKVTCSNTTGPTSGNAASGTWSCVLTFPAGSQTGSWGVSVRAADAALNIFIALAGTITVVNQ